MSYLDLEDKKEDTTTNNTNKNLIYTVDSEDNSLELLELSDETILVNGIIYVPIEDVKKVFNVNFRVNGQSVYINDLNSLFARAKAFVESNGKGKISTIYENVRALVDNYVIFENSNKKYGVISLDTGEQVLSSKYSKIIYMQNIEEFFVYTDETVGVIDKDGLNTIIEPTKYDSLTVLDEINKLYLAKEKGKYGVLDKQGKIVVPVAYSSIGMKSIKSYDEFEINNTETDDLLDSKYIVVLDDTKLGLYNLTGERILNAQYEDFGYVASESDKKAKIKSTLIIPKKVGIYGIIIKQKGYYGIFDLKNQTVAIPCSFSKIYEKTEGGKSDYYLEFGNDVIPLSEYINENFEVEQENDDTYDESQEESNHEKENSNNEDVENNDNNREDSDNNDSQNESKDDDDFAYSQSDNKNSNYEDDNN